MNIPKFFRVVRLEEREPPMLKFVPTIDEAGEIIIFRRTEHGYNMRDDTGINSPNDNLRIVAWLEPFDHLTNEEILDNAGAIGFELEDVFGTVTNDYIRINAFADGAECYRDHVINEKIKQ